MINIPKKPYGVIYILINKINNKVYIGQTINHKERMGRYKNLSCSDQPKIYNALKKHGWHNFEVHILEIGYNQQDLDQLEDYYIDLFKSIEFGYNCKTGGSGGRPSEEVRAKISAFHSGRPKSEEHKIKMRKPKSEEHKAKISVTLTGRKQTEESNKKRSESLKGEKNHRFGKKFDSEEDKQRNKEAQKHRATPCQCIETDEIFESASDAARKMNLYKGNISAHLRGDVKHVKGYTFRYIDKT